MLVFSSLLFSFPFLSFFLYSWQASVVSFMFLTFLSFFNFYSFGWGNRNLFFSVDIVGSSLVSLSVWLGSLMLLANWGIWLYKNSSARFLFFVLFLILVLVGCFSVTSFLSFYILFELSLIPTFFLILGWGYQPERLGASIYIVIYTVGASLPLLGCFLYSYSVFGHLRFFLPIRFSFFGFYRKFLFCCFVLAFFVKIPVFFFHLWLPKAHVEAPVAGSMILAGVLLKLGGYGLLRVVVKLGDFISVSSNFYLSFVVWGGVITSVICLRQVDLKALIAYSSIGHISLFVGGVIRNNCWGFQGGLMMLLAHGLCSPAIFALANVGYERVGSRRVLLTKGFISFFPFLSMVWFLICRRNIAAPPSLNLARELMLFISVIRNNLIWGVFFGFISFFSGAYSVYLYVMRQHGQISSFYNSFLPVKVRNYIMLLYIWVPLNMFFLSVGLLVNYFYIVSLSKNVSLWC